MRKRRRESRRLVRGVRPVTRRSPLGSVVIPAHDEAPVIGRCLNALFTGFRRGELDVVVVCNGCADETAALARSSRHSVRVVELGYSVEARRAAGRGRGSFSVPTAVPGRRRDAARIVGAPGAGAAVGRRDRRPAADPLRQRGCVGPGAQLLPCPIADSSGLGSLWGAGVYGLSAAGRRRFGAFPDLVADDLWVDGHFDSAEVEIVDCPPVVVVAPQRSRDLVRVLRRVYFGKSETASAPDPDGRAPETITSTMRDLGRLVAAGPAASLDAATYAAFAAGARLAVSLGSLSGDGWGRDESSRTGGLTVDLLLIARKIWRYRVVTLPVIALTMLGALYVVAVKAPSLQSLVELRADQSSAPADRGRYRRATRRWDESIPIIRTHVSRTSR